MRDASTWYIVNMDLWFGLGFVTFLRVIVLNHDSETQLNRRRHKYRVITETHRHMLGPALLLTIYRETLQVMNLNYACRYLGYWDTGHSDMRATKVVWQTNIVPRDLIKCHPPTPDLATELFTSKNMGVFRFSVALCEWSESELNNVKQLYIQVYKNAWHLPQSTSINQQVLSSSSRRQTQVRKAHCLWHY